MVFGLILTAVGLFLLLWGLHGFGVLSTVGATPDTNGAMETPADVNGPITGSNSANG